MASLNILLHTVIKLYSRKHGPDPPSVVDDNDTSIANKKILIGAVTILVTPSIFGSILSYVLVTREKDWLWNIIPFVIYSNSFMITVFIHGLYFVNNAHMTKLVFKSLKEEVMHTLSN